MLTQLQPARQSGVVGDRARGVLCRTATMRMLGLLSLAACGREARLESAQSPTLALIDSIVLVEDDSAFVGEPGGLAALSDGSFLVSDLRNVTIHHYSGRGFHLGFIGRKGGGPGEFDGRPSDIVVEDDSTLYVKIGPVVKVFDLRTGSETWQRTLPGTAFPPSVPLAPEGGRFFFRHIDRTHRTSVASIASAVDSPVRGGPFPQQLGRSLVVDDVFSYLQVARLSEDSIAVAIELSDYVFFGPFKGPFDSVMASRLHRNGARPDLVAEVRDADPQASAGLVYELSYPFGLHELSSGNLAYLTGDVVRLGSRLGAEMHLSVLDLGERRSCPDAVIPVPADPRPLAAFSGDTLVTLSQHLSPDGTPRTVLHRYMIKVDGCRWVEGA